VDTATPTDTATPDPDIWIDATLPASGNAYQVIRSATFGDLATGVLLAAILIALIGRSLLTALPQGVEKVSEVDKDSRDKLLE
jgi:hypothetical protein